MSISASLSRTAVGYLSDDAKEAAEANDPLQEIENVLQNKVTERRGCILQDDAHERSFSRESMDMDETEIDEDRSSGGKR